MRIEKKEEKNKWPGWSVVEVSDISRRKEPQRQVGSGGWQGHLALYLLDITFLEVMPQQPKAKSGTCILATIVRASAALLTYVILIKCHSVPKKAWKK